MTTWYNDEEVDYRINAQLYPAGGGPMGTWPEHRRLLIQCSVCGDIASNPTTTGLLDLIIEVEAHHHNKHAGPDWRVTPPAGTEAQALT